MATEYRISSRWQLTDPTDHIQDGARRVCEHFRSRPHAVLEMDDEARRLLLGSLAARLLRPLHWFLSREADFSISSSFSDLHEIYMPMADVQFIVKSAGGQYPQTPFVKACKSPSLCELSRQARLTWRQCMPMLRASWGKWRQLLLF